MENIEKWLEWANGSESKLVECPMVGQANLKGG